MTFLNQGITIVLPKIKEVVLYGSNYFESIRRGKTFLQSMAKFEGKSLSELIRERTLASLEDEYDAKIGDMKLEEYEKYLASGGEILNWDEL